MPCDAADSALKIVDFQEAHLPEILAIERASFPRPWNARAFLAEARHPTARIRVLLGPRGRVLGYAVFRRYDQAVHLLNLAVAPACRRQGLGRRLLEEVVQQARRARLPWVVLEVRVSNRAAQRFYEAFGFRRIQRLPGYYDDEDGWLYLYEVPAAHRGGEAGEREPA